MQKSRKAGCMDSALVVALWRADCYAKGRKRITEWLRKLLGIRVSKLEGGMSYTFVYYRGKERRLWTTYNMVVDDKRMTFSGVGKPFEVFNVSEKDMCILNKGCEEGLWNVWQ